MSPKPNYLPVMSNYTLTVLRQNHQDIPYLVAEDLKNHDAFYVMDNLSSYHREVHRIALQLALEHLHGRMPPSWQTGVAFAQLGSGARSEQSIFSDQDHALLYGGFTSKVTSDEDAYYQKLGEVTAAMLHEIGYPFCTGNIMASNARWRGTLAMWEARIQEYADLPDWDNLRFLLIAADARTVIGEKGLVAKIRQAVAHVVARSPYIRYKVSDQALTQKVALSLLGGIKLEVDPLHKGKFSIKEGLYSPLVNCVRIWALSMDVGEPSTTKRIERLIEKKAWTKDLALPILAALETALYFRLRHHVKMALSGQTIDDYVSIDELSDAERERIKRAMRVTKQLSQITARQFPRPG